MSKNFNYMWDKLPEVMQQPNTKKFYMAIAKIFDELDQEFAKNETAHVLDFATGEDLDILGINLGIVRGLDNDEQYRQKLKIYYYTYYFVPNLNNFLWMIRNVMGYYPQEVTEGWTLGGAEKESGVMKIKVKVPPGQSSEFVNLFDDIAGAGVRLDWDTILTAYRTYEVTGDQRGTGLTNITKIFEAVQEVLQGQTTTNYCGTKFCDEPLIYNYFKES